MRSIAPAHLVMRRSRTLLEIAFVLVAAGIFLMIVGLMLYALPVVESDSASFPLFNLGRGAAFVGGIVLGLIGIGLGIRAVTQRAENDLAKVTDSVLQRHLDDRFTFVRNVNKRRLGYIDAVLVGPPGAIVFRIVGYDGTYLNERGKWMQADSRGRWQPMFVNPTHDVVEDVKALRRVASEKGVTDLPVYGLVIFTEDDDQVKLSLKDPLVPAMHLSRLPAFLEEKHLGKSRMEAPAIQAVVDLLVEE
jgi:hypothetical protein